MRRLSIRSRVEALCLALYGAAMRLLIPAWLLRLWWRGRREPLYRQCLRERLGLGPPAPAAGAVWVHAVSLGETRAAAPLVAALRAAHPDLRLLLTHGTATGREAGRALLAPGDVQVWLPLDTPGATRRFVRRHRPAVGVLMETEVWPQLLAQAHRQGVPMVLANARLSGKSLRQGLRWAALLRPAVASLAAVLAQTEDDAQRLRQMGAVHVRVCGNLKFDLEPEAPQVAQGRRWRARLNRGVVLLASSREGEEAALLRAWASAWPADAAAPRPLLLVVPRHPQRFDAMAALMQDAGLRLARRRDLGADAVQGPVQEMRWREAAACDAWLGDSMGEMALYYAMADVALLGGSFEPLGGQNLIEAAACGCPLVMGPHTFNFDLAARQALAAGAAVRAADIGAALQQALALVADPAGLPLWRARALGFAQAHRGAAARMAATVHTLARRPRP